MKDEEYAELIGHAQAAEVLGAWGESLTLYEQAAAVATSPSTRAFALKNGAIASRRAGEVLRAIALARKALAALEGQPASCEGDAQLAEVDVVLANALVDNGETAEGRPYLEDAVKRFEAIGRTTGRLQAEIGLGRLLAVEGRLQEAEALFRRCLAMATTSPLRSQALNNLAVIRRLVGDLEEALRLFELDVRICREQGDAHGEVVALANLADAELASGRGEQAGRDARRASDLCDALKIPRPAQLAVFMEKVTGRTS
jgi:tetratricopeptide (TPR) repeat protein